MINSLESAESPEMKRKSDFGLLSAVIVYSIFWVGVVVAMVIFVSRGNAAWEKVAQEWEPYRLNESQKQWFKSVRPKHAGPACCDIADGHPTQQDHRADGWYIPNPFHTDWDWVRVPDDAFTIPGSNPIGVATVWYGAQNPDGTPYIRCFVPEAET